MKISIISAFDPIPGDDAQLIRYAILANIFAGQNHHVDYFTSSFFHLNKTQRLFNLWQDHITGRNIRLHLIRTNSYHKNISLLRLINHYFFAVRLKKYFTQLIYSGKPDLVIISFPPVLSSHYIVRLCNKHNIRVIIDVQDFWPDAFRMIITYDPLFKIISFPLLRRKISAFRNATMLSCVSETYKNILLQFKKPENIHVYKLGFNNKLFLQQISDKWNLIPKKPGEKWIVFLGTASHNPDLMNIPLLASRLPEYRFILLGKNQSYEKMQRIVSDHKINNILVVGSTTFNNIVNILHRSDVGLLFIDPLSGTSMPNKLFYYLFAGLPVVSNYRNSDLSSLSDQMNCIFFSESGNTTDLVQNIQKAVKISESDRNKFRNFAIENFDSEMIYTDFYNWAIQLNKNNQV
jgi:hypothetical protein